MKLYAISLDVGHHRVEIGSQRDARAFQLSPREKENLFDGLIDLGVSKLEQSVAHQGSKARDDVAEIRLSAPNRHHFLADLAPFGLDNPGEVFHAADRPYGLIQCAVQRDDAPDPGPAWDYAATFA